MANTEVRYAGFWIRLGARLLDAVVILGVGLIGALIISPILTTELVVLIFEIIFVLFVVVYTPYFLAKEGATPGKSALGLVVVNAKYQYPLSIKSALWRGIVAEVIVDRLTFSLGNLLIVFDPKKQALHDKISGTYVVYKNSLKNRAEH
ncbi:RDD family protein [Candidatus Micrarchaeota archaeon]|nr:RDD family protein [Candidatus Micrarchaeota archaeon]